MGNTMFHVVNAYTRAAQFEGLSAEASYRLQKVGGNGVGNGEVNSLWYPLRRAFGGYLIPTTLLKISFLGGEKGWHNGKVTNS